MAITVPSPHECVAHDLCLQNQKLLKPDYIVTLLQCLKQVVDVLHERAKQDPAQTRQVFEEKVSVAAVKLAKGKGKAAPESTSQTSLREVLDALLQERRQSQAICGHTSKLYVALDLPLPSELQKSTLSKQERKKLRREEKKKRQEERERKRFEKLAQKKLKYQLLAQQAAAADGNGTNGGERPMDAENAKEQPQEMNATLPAANGVKATDKPREKTNTTSKKAKKRNSVGGKSKGKQSQA